MDYDVTATVDLGNVGLDRPAAFAREWLPAGEFQGGSLVDLQTQDNCLSVYLINDDAHIERVAVALAANRKHLDVLEVVSKSSIK